ncbi:MAG: hypothetical protein LBV17_12225 [Treponema sp.]|nr:hypothetical protein [Treponema sp.]
MRKAVFFAVFAFITALVFGQNLKDYTPLTAGNIADAARLTQTRYAAPCEIKTATVQGQKVHIFQSGTTAISFDMTAEQERQLDAIRGERDMPLVLFTRRGTNRDNYRFVVDRLIPLKNVLGVVSGDLPKSFTSQDFYAVLDLYFQNQKTDPDGRVAERIRQAKAEADKAQEVARIESARRLDAANREAFLNSATVGGGYKPVFRQGSIRVSDIAPFQKIVVLGTVSRDQVKSYNFDQSLYLTKSDSIVSELVNKRDSLPRQGRDYEIFLFLTKSGRDYILDRYVFYYDLIKDNPPEPYPSIKQAVFDAWIIDNADE